MGTDCAPLVADLFLFSLEFSFMKDLIRTNLSLAGKFNRTFRYIDDLLTILTLVITLARYILVN